MEMMGMIQMMEMMEMGNGDRWWYKEKQEGHPKSHSAAPALQTLLLGLKDSHSFPIPYLCGCDCKTTFRSELHCFIPASVSLSQHSLFPPNFFLVISCSNCPLVETSIFFTGYSIRANLSSPSSFPLPPNMLPFRKQYITPSIHSSLLASRHPHPKSPLASRRQLNK